ncbi:MAG: hypothetical protein NHB14_20650 [Desulfosporosinus sp.]|nr:hypothetical protein [Desulfosporosinus sp.]
MAKTVKLELVAGYGSITGKTVTLSRGKGQKSLKFVTGIFNQIQDYEVTGIGWQEKAERSLGMGLGGGVVGGLLAGPLGLAAGAALGGRKKDKSTAVIQVNADGMEAAIYVRCDAKEYEELTRLIM